MAGLARPTSIIGSMADCCGGQADSQSCCSSGDGCCKVDAGVRANTEEQRTGVPTPKGKDIDRVFDDLFFLEESIINKGMEEGIAAGKRAGFQDAYSIGYANGSEIGKEVGFYHGHVIGWKALMEKYPDLFSTRYYIHSLLLFLQHSLPSFPIYLCHRP